MMGRGVINKIDINAVVHKEVWATHVSSRSERQLTTSCCVALVQLLSGCC